jgi:hypothetical protein
MYGDQVVKRDVTLAGALQGPAPLAQRCGDIVGLQPDRWDDLTPVDCAAPHDLEYVGALRVPGINPPAAKIDSIADDCWDVVAKYTGGTRRGLQVGYLAWGLDAQDWQRGDRWLRCYAWRSRKMVGSVKGIGNRAPRG